MELFGFEIKRADQKEKEQLQAIVPQTHEDGATEVSSNAAGVYGGTYGTYVDIEGRAKDEADLVTKYREMALQPECDFAIEDIINDAIIMDDNVYPVELVLDETDLPNRVKKLIRDEFDRILYTLDFGNKGYEIFRRWYVDGRLYYQVVIDEKNIRDGIKELRYIDPRKIKKIRKQNKKKDPKSGATLYTDVEEFYYYNPKGMVNQDKGVKIAKDSICHVTSGLIDPMNKLTLGHLHKAIKPMNQLRMLEDATVIYRLSRAPERRIFYIDVGNLPKAKAEQYLRDMMVKHKNKLVYDANTGEVRDDRRHMTMLEDFWLPRREGGRGTEITTLPGGQNLGELDDVLYFQKKLYKALNVPISRLEAEVNFNIGRSTEISRDELKFQKFINRIRNKFAVLFDNLLEVQLVLRGIMTKAEWEQVRNSITYNFVNDNHFEELKEGEIMAERLRILGEVDPLVGKYFSLAWVRKNVLRMTEEEIDQMQREIDMESDENDEEEIDLTPSQPQEEEVFPEFKPEKELTEEEKRLVESMTKFYDSFSSQEDIDNGSS
jgi:hypothetical protein